MLKFTKRGSDYRWEVLKFVKLGSDYRWEVLKFTKRGSDYRWEVLKFVKLSNQKCWVYDNSQKNVVKRLGVLTMPALKYCILRGSFSEMFDSLAIITSFGGLRTRARTDARTDGIIASEICSSGKEA